MEERKILNDDGVAVSLSEFMRTEVYRIIPQTANDTMVYEVSNYGNIRVNNKRMGRTSYNTITRSRIFINADSLNTRIFAGVVFLNVFLGEEFKPGDRVMFIDGDKDNFRLDNLRRIDSSEELASDVSINTIRKHYPLMDEPAAKVAGKVTPTFNKAKSKIAKQGMVMFIRSVLAQSDVPIPASLLYITFLKNDPQFSEEMDRSEFINFITPKFTDDNASVYLKFDGKDVGFTSRGRERGLVSLRIAKLLKSIDGVSTCFKYAVNKTDHKQVTLIDNTNSEVGVSFKYYDAPYINDAVDVINEVFGVYIYANVIPDTFDHDGIRYRSFIHHNGEDIQVHVNHDYYDVMENTMYLVLSNLISGKDLLNMDYDDEEDNVTNIE